MRLLYEQLAELLYNVGNSYELYIHIPCIEGLFLSDFVTSQSILSEGSTSWQLDLGLQRQLGRDKVWASGV